MYYDQWRSQELWLNHTLSIIMNYFAFILPMWCDDTIEAWDKKFYWIARWKIFHDMPSISMAEVTLKSHISKLVSDWLLERKIIKKKWENNKWYYRATEIYTKWEKTAGMNFISLYNELELLLKDWKIKSNEKDKISNLLSSYSGQKKKSNTTYNLEGVEWSPILNYLREEFILSEKWEWVNMSVWCEVNLDWIKEHIMLQIQEKWLLHWWIALDQKWEPDMNDSVKGAILSKLKTMFQWMKDNEVEVKSMKWRINTFFWKKYI